MHSLFCYVCLLSSLLWTSLSSNPTVGSSSHFYNSPCHFLPTLITVWQNIERSLKFILYFSTYYLCFLIIFWSIGSQCNQCDWEEDGLCWMDINAYDMVSRQMTGPVWSRTNWGKHQCFVYNQIWNVSFVEQLLLTLFVT